MRSIASMTSRWPLRMRSTSMRSRSRDQWPCSAHDPEGRWLEMEEKSKSSAIYQITIEAHPEHVLATLRDLPAYPDWQDDITTVEVLRFDDHGLPAEATMAFNSMG